MQYCDLQDRKIMILGFGSIGPAVLPLILRHIKVKPSHIIAVDADARNQVIAELHGIKFVTYLLTEQNYEPFLLSHLKQGDILLNLTYGISSLDLIRLCQQHDILYMDTSNEVWATADRLTRATTGERRRWAIEYKKKQTNNASTALICHGANPGLISHFAKQAIQDVFAKMDMDKSEIATNDWATMAKAANIVTLHVSEKDTQTSHLPRAVNEYINSWSIEGFFEEASEYANISWGTHEMMPPEQEVRTLVQCDNYRAIELSRRAHDMMLHSWVPSIGAFQGFVIPHAESFSLAEYLSVKNEADEVIYHPTVHYVYSPCQDAIDSMQAAAKCQWDITPTYRLILNDIASGEDELGLLVLRKGSSEVYWYGSTLSIQEARELVPHNNATSLQVAAGVLIGLIWIIEHPKQGLIEAEQIDHERALSIAAPYLGKLGGAWSHWHFASKEHEHDWQFNKLMVNPW